MALNNGFAPTYRGGVDTITSGGAVHISTGATLIANGDVFKGDAFFYGGAIAAAPNSTAYVVGAAFLSDIAELGSGVAIVESNALVNATNATFANGSLYAQSLVDTLGGKVDVSFAKILASTTRLTDGNGTIINRAVPPPPPSPAPPQPPPPSPPSPPPTFTDALFTTPGNFTWVAPAGITSVSVVAVGGGGGGGGTNAAQSVNAAQPPSAAQPGGMSFFGSPTLVSGGGGASANYLTSACSLPLPTSISPPRTTDACRMSL